MAKLLIDDRDQKFVLFEQLKIGKLSESKLYADFDEEVYAMVLDEAQELATKAMMPTNSIGDLEGCVFKDGNVAVPTCFHDLWSLWNQGEWRRLDLPQEIGGQGILILRMLEQHDITSGSDLENSDHCRFPQTLQGKITYIDCDLLFRWSGTFSGRGCQIDSSFAALAVKSAIDARRFEHSADTSPQ